MSEPASVIRRPACVTPGHDHYRLYVDVQIVVWRCRENDMIWTDPPSDRPFKIEYGFELQKPVFSWVTMR